MPVINEGGGVARGAKINRYLLLIEVRDFFRLVIIGGLATGMSAAIKAQRMNVIAERKSHDI